MGNHGEVSNSPSPVMTFEAGGRWLAVRVDQVDRVAVAPRLWPVPLAARAHAGLFDAGSELVPVMHLDEDPAPEASEHLLALLHVRGSTVGLTINRAGRVYERWSTDDAVDTPPLVPGAVAARCADHRFWLVDADRLFADGPDHTQPRVKLNGGLAERELPLDPAPSRGP